MAFNVDGPDGLIDGKAPGCPSASEGKARLRLCPFLDEALSAQVSDAELKTLRNATRSDIYCRDGGEVRKMLAAASGLV